MRHQIAATLLSLFILSSCQTNSSPGEGRWVDEEITLYPTQVATSLRRESHLPCKNRSLIEVILWGLDTSGLGGLEGHATKGGILVGVQNWLGDLCGSPAQIDRETSWFRGAVLFDVSRISARGGGGRPIQVQRAWLYLPLRDRWIEGDVDLRNGRCPDQVMVSTAAFPATERSPNGADFFKGAHVPTGARLAGVSSGAVNVALAVYSWVNGAAPNRGFVLAAEDEDVNRRSQTACVTHYGDIMLHVRYRYWMRSIFPTEKTS